MLLNDEWWGFSNIHPTPSGYKDLQSTALHELGHILGLCHSNNSSTIMWISMNPLSNKRTLHSYDIEGINVIYDRIAVKNKFVNPNASVSYGGIVNVGYQNYDTQNLPNNEKLFAFDDGSTRHFEAQEQVYQSVERKFNSTQNRQGGWFKNNTLISLNANMNQQIDDATYMATYKYKTTINLNATTEFDEVADFGSIGSVFQYESGNVTAPDPRTYNNKSYRFAGWKDNLTLPNTRQIIPEGNTTLEAYYKLPNYSNNITAFSSNSQKKLVRDSYGYLHKVYTSMGKVWYEKSTDNGSTWEVQNFGKPLATNQSKLPSIDEYGGDVVIVWQEEYSTTYKIRMAYNNSQGTELIFNDVFDWFASGIDPAPYSSDATPVVSWVYNHIFVCWRINNGLLSSGLYFKYGTGGPFWPLVWHQFYGLDDTDGSSSNPTTASNKDPYSPVFNLAWQHGTTAIKYCNLTPDGTDITISSIETPSTGDGFSFKINPSISVKSDGYPTLVYIGSLYQGATTQVTKRSRSSGSWGTFAKYGSNVNSPTEYNSIIVWSESNVNKLYRPWSSIRTLSTVGQNVQASTGSSAMYAVAYRQYSPYDFQTSPNLLTLPKINSAINKCGREEILAKGEAEFYFILGDIFVGNEVINFPEITDTTNITNTEELNEYMQSNTFTINESSNFTFSIAYGAADSLKALNELTGGSLVQFNIELVAGVTNELIGELGDFILDADNIYTCQVQSYQVNTQSLENRTVKLRITASTNFAGAYYLANIITEEEVLGKRDFEELNISNESVVTSYDLFQNYPNPFNPTTTIKYQIPEDGLVTLKVFDVLGKEVKSLVNDQQTAGKYEVNINASDLASGVYIYQLQVNSFISTKKMILLK